MSLFELEHLSVGFDTPHGTVQALADVSLVLEEGRALGLVGESGSGKSVIARTLLGLLPRNARVLTGTARFDDRDLLRLPQAELRALRGHAIATVPQDPNETLDPLVPIGHQLSEVLEVHLGLQHDQTRRRCAAALDAVDLHPAEALLNHYPHQLSPGERLRVLVAMAALLEPRVLIVDEPPAPLEVTLQAQVLGLVERLREQHGTAVLYLTRDLGLVARTCERGLVLLAGRVVEDAPVEELLSTPLHPFTRGLLEALPRLDRAHGRTLRPIREAPRAPHEPGAGCSFAPRCPLAAPHCSSSIPPLEPLHRGAQGTGLSIAGHHRAACFEKARLAAEPRAEAGS